MLRASWQSRGVTIRVVDRVTSTQDELLRLLAVEGGRWPHLSGLRAESQTGGRGRTGRAWDTENVRALTVSFVLRPQAPPQEWGTIALRAGLAVVRALGAHGIDTLLKWPNDVVVATDDDVDGWHGIGKVGGVLGSVGADSEGPVCVVGIGINLEGHPDVPGAAALETDLPAHDLARDIQAELARTIPAHSKGLSVLESDIARSCHTLGKQVVVTFPPGSEPAEIRGEAVRIDPDGALVVATRAGERRILSGDIAHTRIRRSRGPHA